MWAGGLGIGIVYLTLVSRHYLSYMRALTASISYFNCGQVVL